MINDANVMIYNFMMQNDCLNNIYIHQKKLIKTLDNVFVYQIIF